MIRSNNRWERIRTALGSSLSVYTVLVIFDTVAESSREIGPVRTFFPGTGGYGMGQGSYFYFSWCLLAFAYAVGLWIQPVVTRKPLRATFSAVVSATLICLAVGLAIMVGYSSGMSH